VDRLLSSSASVSPDHVSLVALVKLRRQRALLELESTRLHLQRLNDEADLASFSREIGRMKSVMKPISAAAGGMLLARPT
jgi:hypothetical protein